MTEQKLPLENVFTYKLFSAREYTEPNYDLCDKEYICLASVCPDVMSLILYSSIY